MSHIFQRPLCDMGKAYDYAFRPVLGEPEAGSGGPCDDRPRPVELLAANLPAPAAGGSYLRFQLCPEHEAQLRRLDARMPAGSRFRPPTGPTAPGGPR
jgi:hypothetical protein